MSSTNVEFPTWFDYFPTEIIFMIFNYLSSNDIIYTFFFFNQRFNDLLLENHGYLNHFELSTTNLDVWRNVLSIIGSQITCLSIKKIDLSFPLDFFSNLKFLIISVPFNFPNDNLSIIFEKDQFQNLHSLAIKRNQYFPHRIYDNYSLTKTDILKKVINDENSLKTFQCSRKLIQN
jgi:hypothetical protein